MSRVIIFSERFPKYHIRPGQPTFFVENIQNYFHAISHRDKMTEECKRAIGIFKKKHTIRKGNRWKVGDMFSPRVWSGLPRRSKTIKILYDIEIKQVWNIEIDLSHESIKINGKETNWHILVAANDGLDLDDFKSWFGKDLFIGQIICWADDEEVYY